MFFNYVFNCSGRLTATSVASKLEKNLNIKEGVLKQVRRARRRREYTEAKKGKKKERNILFRAPLTK